MDGERLSALRGLEKKDYLVMVLLVASAFAIRLYFNQFYRVISADGISYVAIAEDFINGRGFAAATHYPPFFPILLGLASVPIGDFELAGRVVSIMMGSLLVVPVYLLGVEFFRREAAVAAAVLSIAWPSLRAWSGEVMSQATYITLLLFGVYLVWIAVHRLSSLAGIGGGVCMAAAHLTRSEGVLVFLSVSGVLLIAVAAGKLPRKALRPLVFAWVSFWIVFAPYFFLLHKLTGAWQLTGKSKVAIADGLSMYLNRPDIKHDPHFSEIGYLDLFREYPDYLRHNLVQNAVRCWREMLPVYLWCLALVGFLSGGWRSDFVLMRSYLLATFTPLVVIIVFFFIGPEYTQAYIPVLFLWSSEGLCRICRLLSGLRGGLPLKYSGVAGAVPVAAAVLVSGQQLVAQIPADRDKPYHYSQDGGRYDEKLVGIRLRSIVPKGEVIMTRSGRTGFYAQRPYVIPPQAGFAEIVDSARRSKVKYVVATMQLLNMRRQLEPLYTPLLDPGRTFVPPAGFELVYIGEEPGGLPYLVYRLH